MANAGEGKDVDLLKQAALFVREEDVHDIPEEERAKRDTSYDNLRAHSNILRVPTMTEAVRQANITIASGIVGGGIFGVYRAYSHLLKTKPDGGAPLSSSASAVKNITTPMGDADIVKAAAKKMDAIFQTTTTAAPKPQATTTSSSQTQTQTSTKRPKRPVNLNPLNPLPVPGTPKVIHPSFFTLFKSNKGFFLKTARSYAVRFGFFLGIFNVVDVGVTQLREEQSAVNKATAGFVAGAVAATVKAGPQNGFAFGCLMGVLGWWTFEAAVIAECALRYDMLMHAKSNEEDVKF